MDHRQGTRHASKLRLKVDVGEDLAPARGERVADLAEQWKEVVRLTRRPNTVKSYLRLLDTHVVPVFGKVDPRTITRNMVEHWHATSRNATVPEANRALHVLSALMSWLERDGKVAVNPCKGVKKRPENASAISFSTRRRLQPPMRRSTPTPTAGPHWHCGWRC